jgi:tellurite resistance protein TerC
MNVETLLGIVSHVVVGAMLAVDLGVFQRPPHTTPMREAPIWSVVWISGALLFKAGVWALQGSQVASGRLTAYLVEKALSVDNLFVFLVIFAYFAVPDHPQPRALLWGVLGAVPMRASLIAVGVTLVKLFYWVLYFFGALPVYTGGKLFRDKEDTVDPSRNPVLQAVRRRFPVPETYPGGTFFVGGREAVGHAPVPGPAVGGEYRPDVGHRFHPHHPGHHAQPLHRQRLQTIFTKLPMRALFFVPAAIMDVFRYLKCGLSFGLGLRRPEECWWQTSTTSPSRFRSASWRWSWGRASWLLSSSPTAASAPRSAG